PDRRSRCLPSSENFPHSSVTSQAVKMEKLNLFCKLTCLALIVAATVQLISASPLHEAEDPISVPSIQFQSKASEDLCIAYQLNGKMFITLTRCLGAEASNINQITDLNVVGQGKQTVQTFALQPAGTDSVGDIAVIMYTGAVSDGELPQETDGGLFEKFGLRSHVRFVRRRQDAAPPADAGNATDSATLAGKNAQLIGAALTFVGSVLLMS
ncbi:uncharacterized protein LOC134209878, partial [Armigeres subalbatus]|uniref:uncharacterized protein LOC134209878 n=1 Tax=Armigeres subalbatus TaxID=124917 RepID=UPI002ED608D8